MHIGIDTLAAHRRKTGIGTYVSSLVNHMPKAAPEHSFTLFVSHENAEIFDDAPNVRKVFAPRLADSTRLRVPWEHTILPALIRSSGVDLLHGPTFVSALLSTTSSVITIHDMTWFTHPGEHVTTKVRYFQSLIPIAARRARKVIAITESTRRDILGILRLPESKVETVHYGVDPIFQPETHEARLREVRRELGIGGSYILFVGMLEPRKNLVRIIEAFAALHAEGVSHHLILAGPKGWGYEEAAQRVQQLGLSGRIRFTGPIPHNELPALFSAADLFVFPSLSEGFGLPVVEAMACGTPVITSNVSSLPEVAGDAALLVDPLDVAGLADAMRRALFDAELRAEMRARGLAQAGRFSWDETAQRTLYVYEQAAT